jgi:tRNA-splicing ligase RtcB (3'-phosphate/5'-hydroxy nucleic acid ligase)
VFDTPTKPADRDAVATLAAEVADCDLAGPAIALPDFHHKADKEMPSSIAVATLGTIRPTLSSASLNCGMALVALDAERPRAAAITDLYDSVRERYPYPPSYRPNLTPEEVVRCAAEGSSFAVERFGIDPAVLDRVEEGGRIDVDRYGGIDRVRRELPWSVRQLSRIRFGTIGPSNHFIELQEVDEIFDPEAARLLGLEAGQVTLQFHGGGGSLPGELGCLFGRRRRYPKAVRAQMAVQKPLYHLGRARSVEELKLRKRLYFSRACPPLDRDSAEGQRLMLANAMAMNYGFAFRLAAYASLRTFVRESLGATASSLIVDSPHNTIYEEQVDGAPALVHRHNAARAFPASRMAAHPLFGQIGQALLVPGTNRTSSYVCTAGEGAVRSLCSASHGAGTTIKELVQRGHSEQSPSGRATLRFRYSRAGPVEVPHLDDRGIDEAVRILSAQDIVRPVARLRPFAVLN